MKGYMVMEKIEMDNIELSIVDIIKTLLKRWWVILISTILCGAIMFAYSTFAITPLYGSRIQFYVAPEFGNSQATTAITAYQTYTYAKEAILTYMKLLDNDEFFDILESKVDGKCQIRYSSKALSSMISYSDVEDTDLFYATVVSVDPGDAYIIAQELAALAPERIHKIKGFDALKVTDSPNYERVSRVNDVTVRNTLVGLVLGAVISTLALVLVMMFDDRIGDEDDLHKMYENVPILGVIPNFEDTMSRANKKYGYQYGGKPDENK